MHKRVGIGGKRFERARTSRFRLLWFRYSVVVVVVVVAVVFVVVGDDGDCCGCYDDDMMIR